MARLRPERSRGTTAGKIGVAISIRFGPAIRRDNDAVMISVPPSADRKHNGIIGEVAEWSKAAVC